MTVMHFSDVSARLTRFLERRQIPRRIEGKEAATRDEIKALSDAVYRSAPRDTQALAAWWPAFERALGEIGSGLWPTEREIKDAAKIATAERPVRSGQASEQTDAVAITAQAMDAGRAVGEGWLYGRNAVELIRRQLVTREVMTAYRSGAFLARREIYGEAAALQWEAEAKARHDAAKLMLRDTEARPRNAQIPDKTSPAKGFAA